MYICMMLACARLLKVGAPNEPGAFRDIGIYMCIYVLIY